MDSNQLIANLNSINVGDLEVIRDKLEQAREACRAIDQPELADKLQEAVDVFCRSHVLRRPRETGSSSPERAETLNILSFPAKRVDSLLQFVGETGIGSCAHGDHHLFTGGLSSLSIMLVNNRISRNFGDFSV